MSQIARPLAEAVAQLIAGMDVAYVAGGKARSCTVTPHVWGPRSLAGSGPWAVINLPGIDRTSLDEPEDQLGADDWLLRFPVDFYVELAGDPETVQEEAISVVEAFISAVDADPTLGGACMEARVTGAGQPEVDDSAQRVLLVIACELEVDLKVPTF